MIELKRYNENDKSAWDTFISVAKNGNFQFYRDYMDYHKDRFTDHSMVILKKNKIFAVLPASEKGSNLVSHGGLSFGGLIMHIELKAVDVLEIFTMLWDYYAQNGFLKLLYKVMPSVFHSYPAEEDLYALFLKNAKLTRRDISSIITIKKAIRFSESKRQAVKKCEGLNVLVREETNFSNYWVLLLSVLEKFGIKPVHTLEEIRHLKNLFPDHIKLYLAYEGEELTAGTVIYDYGEVVHTQYMASSTRGRDIGALDYINYQLINRIYTDRTYYSFGINTSQDGLVFNQGLSQQKEMMGGRAIVYDFYEIDLKNNKENKND